MIFLGVDQSLRSMGLAVYTPLHSEPESLEAWAPKELRDGARLAFLQAQLAQCCTQYKPILAAMEGYSYGSTGKLFELGEIGGVVKMTLAQFKIPVIVVAPSQLKKFVAGTPGADKERMRAATEAKWGLDIPQDDMCDAYGLARVAAAYSLGTSAVRVEMEVVHALKQEHLTVLRPKIGRSKGSL